MPTKGNSIILRIYFAAVALITLVTLMFGAIDFLTIGLRKLIPGADRPDWGYQDCANRPVEIKAAGDTTPSLTDDQWKAQCERDNAMQLENWKNQQMAQMIRNLSLIIISLPLFILHFRVVYKDWKNE